MFPVSVRLVSFCYLLANFSNEIEGKVEGEELPGNSPQFACLLLPVVAKPSPSGHGLQDSPGYRNTHFFLTFFSILVDIFIEFTSGAFPVVSG